jgi:hypothetical protein
MCDYEIRVKNLPGQGKRTRKRRNREFNPNLDAILANARNPLGELPSDFFTNPRKYRKDDSEISQ